MNIIASGQCPSDDFGRSPAKIVKGVSTWTPANAGLKERLTRSILLIAPWKIVKRSKPLMVD